MLMAAHDGAVDHRILVVSSLAQMFKDTLPDAGFGPAGEAAVCVVPVAKAFWQIAPGYPGAIAVEDSLDEQAVFPGGHARGTKAGRGQIPVPVPPGIAQRVNAHP